MNKEGKKYVDILLNEGLSNAVNELMKVDLNGELYNELISIKGSLNFRQPIMSEQEIDKWSKILSNNLIKIIEKQFNCEIGPINFEIDTLKSLVKKLKYYLPSLHGEIKFLFGKNLYLECQEYILMNEIDKNYDTDNVESENLIKRIKGFFEEIADKESQSVRFESENGNYVRVFIDEKDAVKEFMNLDNIFQEYFPLEWFEDINRLSYKEMMFEQTYANVFPMVDYALIFDIETNNLIRVEKDNKTIFERK